MKSRKKYNSGVYTPKNAEKYKGNHAPRYRSSWELMFCRMCDHHPNIISWASESIKIPYYNPITRKNSKYIPDFLIVYKDKNGNRKQELIEIKPSKHTHLTEAKSTYDKIQLAINAAKWKACAAWCKKHGITFRVINENQIFETKKKKK